MEALPVSFVRHERTVGKRNVKKVPFVELFDGRLQGVVSSGSDIKRVYVSFIAMESGDFYCSTNNNRPCGGLYGSPCKHIGELVKEAVLQFGAGEVAEYLKVPVANEKEIDHGAILNALSGNLVKENAGIVFSRFLNYLRYCELKTAPGPVREMNWF